MEEPVPESGEWAGCKRSFMAPIMTSVRGADILNDRLWTSLLFLLLLLLLLLWFVMRIVALSTRVRKRSLLWPCSLYLSQFRFLSLTNPHSQQGNRHAAKMQTHFPSTTKPNCFFSFLHVHSGVFTIQNLCFCVCVFVCVCVCVSVCIAQLHIGHCL